MSIKSWSLKRLPCIIFGFAHFVVCWTASSLWIICKFLSTSSLAKKPIKTLNDVFYLYKCFAPGLLNSLVFCSENKRKHVIVCVDEISRLSDATTSRAWPKDRSEEFFTQLAPRKFWRPILFSSFSLALRLISRVCWGIRRKSKMIVHWPCAIFHYRKNCSLKFWNTMWMLEEKCRHCYFSRWKCIQGLLVSGQSLWKASITMNLWLLFKPAFNGCKPLWT